MNASSLLFLVSLRSIFRVGASGGGLSTQEPENVKRINVKPLLRECHVSNEESIAAQSAMVVGQDLFRSRASRPVSHARGWVVRVHPNVSHTAHGRGHKDLIMSA